MSLKIAFRKTKKEKMWSLSIIVLLAVGLTSWILVPSISASLQQGIQSYGNNVATYMFVYNTGRDGYSSRLPDDFTNKISNVPGVEKAYPIVTNWTYTFMSGNWITSDGTKVNTSKFLVGAQSAVIEGKDGFPDTLITLAEGELPDGPNFIFNGLADLSFTLNQSQTVFFIDNSNETVNDEYHYIDNDTDRHYVFFNATTIGKMPYNPMFQQVIMLWNSTFLQQQLGETLYNQTFGGDGANLFIVKAQDVKTVEEVATKLNSILSGYSGYSVIYDQTTVDAQLSFQSGSLILYDLIGFASLFSVISTIFLLTYVFSGRRRWEAGLLLTQGWSWGKINRLFLLYYAILGTAALVVATSFSLLINSQITYSFKAYANILTIPIAINPYFLLSSLIIAFLVSSIAALFAVWRMKKMGIDKLLREY